MQTFAPKNRVPMQNMHAKLHVPTKGEYKKWDGQSQQCGLLFIGCN